MKESAKGRFFEKYIEKGWQDEAKLNFLTQKYDFNKMFMLFHSGLTLDLQNI